MLIFIFLKKNGDNTWHEQRDKQSITTKITGLHMKYWADIWWTQANHSWTCSIPLFDPDLWDAFSGFCNLKRPWGKKKNIYIYICIYIYKYKIKKKVRNAYICLQITPGTINGWANDNHQTHTRKLITAEHVILNRLTILFEIQLVDFAICDPLWKINYKGHRHPMQWCALQIFYSKNALIVFDWSRVIVGRSLI